MSVLRLALIICFTIFSAVGGCALPIPADTPEPYSESKLLRIRVGESTPNWVVSVLGQPNAQLDGGNIWIYGETRMVTLDGLSHDYQSLLVVFENNIVKSYEALESHYGCWAAGLCLVSGWIDYPVGETPVTLDREKTAVVSKREDDSQAKDFVPGNEQCGVYFYKKKSTFLGKSYAPAFSMGSLKDEPLHYKGYIFRAIPSGAHSFTVEDQSMEFECEGGNLMYFEVEQEAGWRDSEFIVRRENEYEGKAAIAERKLLLTW